MVRLNKNIKIFLKYILAPLLAAWLFFSLYRQIRTQPDLSESWTLIKALPFGAHAFNFWLTVALVFVNWGMEAFKWKLLMSPLEKMSFLRAFKSVLSGVTLSINTPNRIGEYGGRMLFVKDGNKIKSIPLSIAGSISQLIITLFMGCAGLIYLLAVVSQSQESILGLSWFWIKVLLLLSLAAAGIILLFFFRMPWLIRLIGMIPVAGRITPYIRTLEQFSFKLLLSLLGLSLFRYLIFILQYLLLWEALAVAIGIPMGIWLVAVLFLVMAVVPSFAIADLGIRGQFSLSLLSAYSSNTVGIVGTTFGIWMLNLFLPALAGSILILSVKSLKARRN